MRHSVGKDNGISKKDHICPIYDLSHIRIQQYIMNKLHLLIVPKELSKNNLLI